MMEMAALMAELEHMRYNERRRDKQHFAQNYRTMWAPITRRISTLHFTCHQMAKVMEDWEI